MSVPIYLVVKGCGQCDENGLQYEVIVDVKLTRFSADTVADAIPGAKVRKMIANKEVSLES